MNKEEAIKYSIKFIDAIINKFPTGSIARTSIDELCKNFTLPDLSYYLKHLAADENIVLSNDDDEEPSDAEKAIRGSKRKAPPWVTKSAKTATLQYADIGKFYIDTPNIAQPPFPEVKE